MWALKVNKLKKNPQDYGESRSETNVSLLPLKVVKKGILLALRQEKLVHALWQKSWAHALWEKTDQPHTHCGGRKVGNKKYQCRQAVSHPFLAGI